MPYLAVSQNWGSLLFAWLAVATVTLGKKYTYCISLLYGILLECTLGSITLFYLIAYPVISMLFAQAFADMSEEKREERRTLNTRKRQDDLPALLRIPLFALCADSMLHAALIIYETLSGSPLTWAHIGHALGGIALTLLCTVIIMIPCRALLGMYVNHQKRVKL